MKIKKQFYGVVILIIVALVATIPPPASATSVQFTGSCEFLEELPSPDAAEWWTNQNDFHIRDEINTFDCDFSDDRLDGVYQMVINWDVSAYFDPFYYVIGQDYGEMTQVGKDGRLVWEGMREVYYTPPRAFSGKVNLQGRGPNTGLVAKADIWGDFLASSTLQLAGNIYAANIQP